MINAQNTTKNNTEFNNKFTKFFAHDYIIVVSLRSGPVSIKVTNNITNFFLIVSTFPKKKFLTLDVFNHNVSLYSDANRIYGATIYQIVCPTFQFFSFGMFVWQFIYAGRVGD